MNDYDLNGNGVLDADERALMMERPPDAYRG